MDKLVHINQIQDYSAFFPPLPVLMISSFIFFPKIKFKNPLILLNENRLNSLILGLL